MYLGDYFSSRQYPTSLPNLNNLRFILFIFVNLKTSYKKGICSSLFLIFYSIFRIFCENFREPDNQLGYIFYNLSMGTLLSLIMLISGIIIFFITRKNEYQ